MLIVYGNGTAADSALSREIFVILRPGLRFCVTADNLNKSFDGGLTLTVCEAGTRTLWLHPC